MNDLNVLTLDSKFASSNHLVVPQMCGIRLNSFKQWKMENENLSAIRGGALPGQPLRYQVGVVPRVGVVMIDVEWSWFFGEFVGDSKICHVIHVIHVIHGFRSTNLPVFQHTKINLGNQCTLWVLDVIDIPENVSVCHNIDRADWFVTCGTGLGQI